MRASKTRQATREGSLHGHLRKASERDTAVHAPVVPARVATASRRMRRGSTRSGTGRRSASRSRPCRRRRGGASTRSRRSKTSGYGHRRRRRLRQEADEWLAGAREGRIPNRQGRRFKPSAVRIYKFSLGDKRLGDIDHADLLWLKEELFGEGCSASTIRNTFTPLQAIFRRARKNGTVAIKSGA